MILADRTIKALLPGGDVVIEPFHESQLQPASYDVKLMDRFMYFDAELGSEIDPEQDNSHLLKEVVATRNDPFRIMPFQFVLAAVVERVGVNSEYVCLLNGKSSLARLGLFIHATAGFVDPGNCLNITLELVNTAPMPIILRPGMKIGQVAFVKLSEPCERPYGSPGLGSKYFGSETVEASRMHLNYSGEGVDE